MDRAVVTTDLGRFELAAGERGLCSAVLLADDAPAGCQAAAATSPRLAEAVDWLQAYAAGDRRPFAGALDPGGSEFQRRVWQRLMELPFGARATYGEIAASLGAPGAARAVGAAAAANPLAVFIPCHRLVGARGSLGGYAWGKERKRALLSHEGAAGAGRLPLG